MIKKILIVAIFAIGLMLIIVFSGREKEGGVSFERPAATTATFAAGCFWCTESLFQELDGVSAVVSGYAGGEFEDPTYGDVTAMRTDHREAVQITFDPEVISYEELVEMMLRSIDPTDDGGQFVDRGFSYTTAIFTHSKEQKEIAEQQLLALADNERFDGFEIVTPVLPYTTFYRAEEYHQDFYLKSPDRYKQYTDASGREQFKAFVWEEIQGQQSSDSPIEAQ